MEYGPERSWLNEPAHVVLASHPQKVFRAKPKLVWGANTAKERGPVVASLTHIAHRNAIGTHGGGYAVYRALALAAGTLQPGHRPDLTNTRPVVDLGPHDSWTDPDKIVSLDPWGATIQTEYASMLGQGYDIRPSIAVTTAHIQLPEMREALAEGRLKADGSVLLEGGDVVVTKAAIEPVWYLPGIARRCGIGLGDLRRVLFECTGGMFPELITRPDLDVLLPPIGGTTVYIFGSPKALADPSRELTVRVHDECNGSDVFGSDICTCRPYLVYGIEEAVRSAQNGGTGLIVYFRKEGRSLGEVTKFLVYNARKRDAAGDRATDYFHRTECVAGVQDMRFQELMPDALHWLGVKKIHRLVSMSDMKYDAIVSSGISVGERITIPDDRIPKDAWVEIQAKKAAGYFAGGEIPDDQDLADAQGRGLHD